MKEVGIEKIGGKVDVKKNITLLIVLFVLSNVISNVFLVGKAAAANQNELMLIENEQLEVAIEIRQKKDKHQWLIHYQELDQLATKFKFRVADNDQIDESTINHESRTSNDVDEKDLVESLNQSKSRWYQAPDFSTTQGTFVFETEVEEDLLTIEFQLDQEKTASEEKNSGITRNILSQEVAGPYKVKSTKKGPVLVADPDEDTYDRKPNDSDETPTVSTVERTLSDAEQTTEKIYLGNPGKPKELILQEWEISIRESFSELEAVEVLIEDIPDYVASPTESLTYQSMAEVTYADTETNGDDRLVKVHVSLEHVAEVVPVEASIDVLLDGEPIPPESFIDFHLQRVDETAQEPLELLGSVTAGHVHFDNAALGTYQLILKNAESYELPQSIHVDMVNQAGQPELQLSVDGQPVSVLELTSKKVAASFLLVNDQEEPFKDGEVLLKSDKTMLSTRSDEQGIVRFEQLPLGQYELALKETDDYQAETSQLILAGETLHLETVEFSFEQALETDNDLTQKDIPLKYRFKPYRLEIQPPLGGDAFVLEKQSPVVKNKITGDEELGEILPGEYEITGLIDSEAIQFKIANDGQVTSSSEQLKADSKNRLLALSLTKETENESVPVAKIAPLAETEPQSEQGYLPETGGAGLKSIIRIACLFVGGALIVGILYLWLNRKGAN